MSHSVQQLAFSPDGQYLAASRARAPVSVWCAETGRSIGEYHAEIPKAPPYLFYPTCFSPDGTLFAYRSGNDTVSVTHLGTAVSIVDFSIHTGRVKHLVFSPCGQFLAASIQRRDTEPRSAIIYVWNVPKQALEMPLEYSGYWAIPTYLPDRTLRVAEVYENEVVIWDTFQQEKLDTFEHRGDTRAAQFSSDGQQFAIASPRDFQVWRENAPQVVSLQGHLGHPNSVTFTQSGKTLVSGHTAGSGIVFWNVAEKRAQQTLLMDTALTSTIPRGRLAVSPDEEFLAAGYTKTIEFWHVASRTRIMTFTEPQIVGPLAFSPTGECFVSTTTDGTLSTWDAQRWKKLRTLTGHTEGISSIAFHPDGKILASASPWDKTARVWDVARGSFVTLLSLAWPLSPNVYKGDEKKIERVLKAAVSNSQKVRDKEIWDITFSDCGTLLAGGLPNEIRLWDATTYETRMVILPPEESRRPFALAFSPCSRYLVSGSWWGFTDKVSIRLWDVTTGENVQTFWGHSTDVQDLAFSPDGALLASAGYDGAILLWDMKPYIQLGR
ncbi:MAG: WD40 repeat domain-containing protein [Candidatus Poribacteria bacterium]|nr:WD40 repeat domain-containing protein [Candidatus Poribacteria bacterium]